MAATAVEAAPVLSASDALLALRTKLLCAETVQADMERRGVPHRWPVALSIEEARALLSVVPL